LSFVVADLTDPKGWDAAMDGVHQVRHIRFYSLGRRRRMLVDFRGPISVTGVC